MVGRAGSWHSWLHSPGGPRVALTCRWTGMGPSVSVWGFRGFQGRCQPAGAGNPLALICEEDDSKMALTEPVSYGKVSSPIRLRQCLCPQGCPNYLLPLLQASARESNQPPFKLLPLFWDSEHMWLCNTLWERVCFPYPSSSPICKPCSSSKADILGVHVPNAGPLGWGAWCETQTPSSLERTSAIVTILLFVGHLPRGVGLDCTIPLSHCGFFFTSLVMERSFLLVFWSSL